MLLGSVTDVREEQSKNASYPILGTPLERVTVPRAEQPENA